MVRVVKVCPCLTESRVVESIPAILSVNPLLVQRLRSRKGEFWLETSQGLEPKQQCSFQYVLLPSERILSSADRNNNQYFLRIIRMEEYENVFAH